MKRKGVSYSQSERHKEGHLMSTCDFYHRGVMERISEEDDICFKRLPLHLHNYKTGPRVYTSTCVFHQYGRSRVDEKRMLLSLMASTHGKHHRAG